jgi:GTPase
LSANYLDYIILVIGANTGITKQTTVLLKMALEMNLPLIVVFTKIDLLNLEDDYYLLNNFKAILKQEKKGKNPLLVKNIDDIVNFSRNMEEGILPIFMISNTKSKGLNLFTNFLNLIPEINKDIKNPNFPIGKQLIKNDTQFDVLESFNVEQKKVGGIVASGLIIKGGKYKIGPDTQGNYSPVEISNIECKKVDVKSASQGQYCSIQFQENIQKNQLRAGMVLLDIGASFPFPLSCMEFEAEIWSFDGLESKIKYKSQYMIHIGHIAQYIKIRKYPSINKENTSENVVEKNDENKIINEEDKNNYIINSSKSLPTVELSNLKISLNSINQPSPELSENKNHEPLESIEKDEFYIYPDKTIKIIFEFMYYPEFVKEGARLIINENNFKVYGFVTKIIK